MGNISKSQAHFFLLKLHSLTGLVPIGLFLTFHLAINSLRTVGALPYQLSIDAINNLPFLFWIEILFILIPLLFHSVMGFYIAWIAKINVVRYRYSRNWIFMLQRLTGGIVFVFLVYHVGTTVVPKIWNGHLLFDAAPFLIKVLNQEFATWTGRIIYMVGITSATFHFANGLWGFCISWGLIIGPRAQRYASIMFMLFGGVLTVLGLATVLEFSLHPVEVEPTAFIGAH